MSPTRSNGRGLVRFFVAILVLTLSMLASYGVSHALRGRPARASAGRTDSTPAPFPSGRYLTAFVFVSSECALCAEQHTKRALGALRDSLVAFQHDSFANISVVGVAIDKDLGAGIHYLLSLGPKGRVFDELSVGNSWMNEFVTALVWRDGVAKPLVPQVVVIGRHVDASGYPRYIEVQPDEILGHISGRDSLIAWVASGTPLGRTVRHANQSIPASGE